MSSSKRRSVLAAGLALAALLLSACAGSAGATGTPGDAPPGEREVVTVTDELGREVELAVPVQSVAVGYNWYNVELIRGVGAGDRIVGVSAEGVEDTPGNAPYWESVPGTQTIVSRAAEFNYDEIIAAGPELFVTLSNSPYEEAIEKLEPFGIPVLVVTAWEPRLFEQNVELLGTVFGTQDRAAELLELYREVAGLLEERTANLPPEDRKSVYFENGEPHVTGVPGSGWHDIIELAGGTNVFGDIDFAADPQRGGTVHTTPVDPADVLDRDPDLVLRHGIDGLVAGYEPFPEDAAAALTAELVARPGWSELTAVRNGDVVVANNFWTSALAKEIGALGLATWLHPELFEDVDTEQYFRRWVEDFQETPYEHSADEYVYRWGDHR